jgi:hypothetical protein
MGARVPHARLIFILILIRGGLFMHTQRFHAVLCFVLATCALLGIGMPAHAQEAPSQAEAPQNASAPPAPSGDVIVGQGWRLNVPQGWRRANAEELAFVRDRMRNAGATQLELVTVLLRADGVGERTVIVGEIPPPPPRMSRDMAAQALAGSGGPGTSTILDPAGNSAAMRGDITLPDGTAWHIRGALHIGTLSTVVVRGEAPTSERLALEQEAPALMAAFSFAPDMAYAFGDGAAAPAFSIVGFLLLGVAVVFIFGVGMVILVYVLVKRGGKKAGA